MLTFVQTLRKYFLYCNTKKKNVIVAIIVPFYLRITVYIIK